MVGMTKIDFIAVAQIGVEPIDIGGPTWRLEWQNQRV